MEALKKRAVHVFLVLLDNRDVKRLDGSIHRGLARFTDYTQILLSFVSQRPSHLSNSLEDIAAVVLSLTTSTRSRQVDLNHESLTRRRITGQCLMRMSEKYPSRRKPNERMGIPGIQTQRENAAYSHSSNLFRHPLSRTRDLA